MNSKPRMKINIVQHGDEISQTVVYDENGTVISGIQKLSLEWDAKNICPELNMTVINFDANIEMEATINTRFGGPYHRLLDEMNPEETVEALKFEAAQHWVKSRELQNSKKEILALKEKITILEKDKK